MEKQLQNEMARCMGIVSRVCIAFILLYKDNKTMNVSASFDKDWRLPKKLRQPLISQTKEVDFSVTESLLLVNITSLD